MEMSSGTIILLSLLWYCNFNQAFKVSPSRPRNFTVERTYNGKLFYFWEPPHWPNGKLQEYRLNLTTGRTVFTWTVPPGDLYYKYELNVTKFGIPLKNDMALNLAIRAVNQHGEGRAASKTFFSLGMLCKINAKIEHVDTEVIKAKVDAPKYCCYAYDRSCTRPQFKVFITRDANESTARYWRLPKDTTKFDMQQRRLEINTAAMPGKGRYWLKLVVLDREGDVIWDSAKRVTFTV